MVAAATSLISAGTEMIVYRGETSPQDRMPATSEGTFPFPVKYGYQVVGRVAAAGTDSGFAVGNRVFARHPHQERFTITAQPTFVVPLPDELDDASATFINLTRVALTGLLDVPVRVGEVAVVFGQGIVGMMCARLARLSASAVVVVDRFPRRRELALKYGADAAVEPANAAAAVAEFSGGRGANVVYEASGAAAALQSALEVVAVEGEIVALSLYGTTPVPLRLVPEFHYRRPRITSSPSRRPAALELGPAHRGHRRAAAQAERDRDDRHRGPVCRGQPRLRPHRPRPARQPRRAADLLRRRSPSLTRLIWRARGTPFSPVHLWQRMAAGAGCLGPRRGLGEAAAGGASGPVPG